LEKAEVEEGFGRDDVLAGGFGTKEHPVRVPSVFQSRVVGCLGGPGNEHDLNWHMVEAGKPTVCLECGQYFVLERKAGAHGDGHGHDDHGHDDHGHGHGGSHGHH